VTSYLARLTRIARAFPPLMQTELPELPALDVARVRLAAMLPCSAIHRAWEECGDCCTCPGYCRHYSFTLTRYVEAQRRLTSLKPTYRPVGAW
jgi:hypothetical protein